MLDRIEQHHEGDFAARGHIGVADINVRTALKVGFQLLLAQNLNLEQVGGSLLVVSQFTLYADTSSRRPGFTGAAKPDLAVPLYERFMETCRARGFRVEHGEFGADMQVASVNDGPVTILFDTDHK